MVGFPRVFVAVNDIPHQIASTFALPFELPYIATGKNGFSIASRGKWPLLKVALGLEILVGASISYGFSTVVPGSIKLENVAAISDMKSSLFEITPRP